MVSCALGSNLEAINPFRKLSKSTHGPWQVLGSPEELQAWLLPTVVIHGFADRLTARRLCVSLNLTINIAEDVCQTGLDPVSQVDL